MDDFLDGFPLTPGFLERYRLAARQRAPASQVGAHLLRRKGQSLELQDLVPFVPGDDFRHVDWRASARLPRPHDLLVRRFEAEEQLTLAISIDNRPSMGALAPASKLRLAAWLAYAVTVMAAAGGDRVFLHSLFGPDATVEKVRRTRASETARRWLAGLPQVSSPQARPAHVQLPPAAVWMILTDLYFEDPGDVLARALAKAQRGWRWIILLDLDNWPHERAALGHGAVRAAGRYRLRLEPGGAYTADDEVFFDVGAAARGGLRIDWRLPSTALPDRLGWRRDPRGPDLRVAAASAAPDGQDVPLLLVGDGYARRRAARIGFFAGSPLLADLNFDVLEKAGLSGVRLPAGFEPVLAGTDLDRDVWIARRREPPGVYLPGLPTGGDDALAHASSMLLANALRWLLAATRLPRPALTGVASRLCFSLYETEIEQASHRQYKRPPSSKSGLWVLPPGQSTGTKQVLLLPLP